MTKLFYLQASPRADRSKSTQVAEAFIATYRQTHPDDEILTVNLFETDLPKFDGFTIQAKYSLMHGKEYSPEEKHAWELVETLINDFKDADKYLVSVPMWNFSIPYRLKQYIDSLVQPGYTFKPVGDGYEGLVKGKPMAVIYARGGAYSEGSGKEYLDYQKKYVELIFGFIGFKNIQSIVVEPTLQAGPDEVRKAVQAATANAQRLAENF